MEDKRFMVRGLIGEKLGHSFSKLIHEKLVDKPYELISLDHDAATTLMESKAFDAINVTIPYKELVMPYIDELDSKAERIQACNCIINKNGKLAGYNTDYDGFLYAIRRKNISLKNKKILVIGKGGAAKAIEVALIDEGVKSIQFLTRTKHQDTLSYDDIHKAYEVDWIINTSPMGMFPNNDQLDIDINHFSELEGIIDIVYNPLYTRLMIEGLKRNLMVVGGLEMLIAQAVKAVELFEDIQLDDSILEELIRSIRYEKENIVLIGMPFSGKSIIGKKLGVQLNKEVIDIDELIVKEIGMTIKDYFENHLEQDFRAVESKVIQEVALKQGVIIVTGGGAIKDLKNYEYLKNNGNIIHIYRPIELMILDSNRPLAKSKEELLKLWEDRKSNYELCQDMIVENRGSIEECLERIVNNYGNHIHTRSN